VRYRETVWSDVFPGNAHTSHCLQPAVEAAETALALPPTHHCRTVWRLDGGAGSDEHLRWLFNRDYQVVAKGMNNRRAEALARQVQRWDAYRADTWLGAVRPPVDYGRAVRMWVKKQRKESGDHHSYYVSSLALPSKTLFMAAYDDRGGAEVEQFRNDKSGLSLEARRKRSFCGQQGYILLTDLAHNLLADFAHRALADTPFASWGLKRIVRDLLAMPGQLSFADGKLVRVELLSLKQFAQDLAPGLERYCADR
jgi:Transposase DDE domain group 1